MTYKQMTALRIRARKKIERLAKKHQEISIVLTRHNSPDSGHLRLWGRKGPMGDVTEIKPRLDGRYDCTVIFGAKSVIKFLKAWKTTADFEAIF